jgi:sulfite reductase beta subunit-like hemoprotein
MDINKVIDLHSGIDIEKEIDEYEKIIHKRLNEDIHPDRFQSYRLSFGTYGVRGKTDGIQMLRIKVPGGFLTSEQARGLADVVEKYAGGLGVGHITTRQDVQIHYINLEDVPNILRMLARVGLTTREACGNTVRNVTASYLSGVSPNEAFDVLPYTLYTTRYFLRHPLTSTLPRKFKIVFSENADDHGMVHIHDIGAVAVRIGKNGSTELGFKVYAGGGLGANPMPARLLTPFVSVDEFYPLAEAIIRIFHRHGEYERKHRNRARLKFLIARIGFDEFQKLVLEEFEHVRKTRDVSGDLDRWVKKFTKTYTVNREELQRKRAHFGNGDTASTGAAIDDPLYQTFLSQHTFAQRQEGFTGVYVKPHIGNLNADEFRSVADLADRYAAGYVSLTPQQKVFIPWIANGDLGAVFNAMREAGFGVGESGQDIVSCPGAYSCRLAITHPYNLANYIRDSGSDGDGLRIHISGCPNSCGQHHVGDIGFYGVSKKLNGRLVPHYVVLLGGFPFREQGIFGTVAGRVPAVNAPAVIQTLTDYWKRERKASEEFHEFVQRKGVHTLREVIVPFAKADPSDETIYREPGMEHSFLLETEAAGECAGSAIDELAISLFNGLRKVYEAEDYLNSKQWNEAADLSTEAVYDGIALLVGLTGAPFAEHSREELLDLFRTVVLSKDWLCSEWEELPDFLANAGTTADPERTAVDLHAYAKRFLRDCDDAFLRLQPDLSIAACAKDRIPV